MEGAGAGVPKRLVVDGVPNRLPLGAGDEPKMLEEPGAGAGEDPKKPPDGAGDPKAGAGVEPNKPPPDGAGDGAEPNKPPLGAGAGVEPNAGAAGVDAKVCVVFAPQVTIFYPTRGYL